VRHRLRELIAALDRRVRQPDRPAEQAIARDAAVLRKDAEERLAALVKDDDSEP
jgi:hypothetical protein